MPIFDQKKVNSVKKTFNMGQKVNKMPFFSNISWKNHCSSTHILSTKCQFSKNTLLSCLYSVKKHNSLKHTVLSYHFLHNLSWKTPCFRTHSWTKKRQLCQNYSILWAQKSIRGSIFSPVFQERAALITIFCKKRPCSQKTFCSHVHILSKKPPSSHKHGASCHLHQFFMKKPLLSCKYLVKMRQFCQNYTILWAIKVKSIPFFRFFTQQSTLSWYFVKNFHSQKTLCSDAHILSKTYVLSKTLCSHVIFFNFLMKNRL